MEAFHHAVQIGDFETVARMLQGQSSLAVSRDRFGFQPIHLLDVYFDARIFRLLLEHGAEVNARNDDGITLLHILADAEAVHIVVAAGAELEAVDMHGRTPLLELSSEEDRVDVIEALLAAGADIQACDKQGHTALALARRRDDRELIEVLLAAGAC